MRRASARRAPARRRGRLRRLATLAAALLCAGFAIAVWARPSTSAPVAPSTAARVEAPIGHRSAAAPLSSDPHLVAKGHELFEEACTSCHGFEGEGVQGQGPSLEHAGEAAVDFYVSTGRMPLGQVGEQPLRGEPDYDDREVEALAAYVGSIGDGPGIPDVDPGRGSVSEGFEIFSEQCQGCHAITGKGGVVIGAYAPPLGESTPAQVGEAIRVGPYVMPRFSKAQISDREIDSVARYVEMTQQPEDAGGFGIGHIGPVPEGLVAWFAAIVALLLVARVIGERGADEGEEEAGEGEGR